MGWYEPRFTPKMKEVDLERQWSIWSLSEPYGQNEGIWWDVVAFDTIFFSP